MKAFKTESKALLGLMIDSIYTNRDVFLRELISNASDAIDKARTLQQEAEVTEDFRIHISFDKDSRLLCVSDTGIGMSHDELEEYLGTIAHSGSRQLKDALAQRDHSTASQIIGQFGVGFYSSFMVADHVTVVSRRRGCEEAFQWKSKGVEGYEIYPAHKESFGTDVILHIRPSTPDINYERYLDQQTIKSLIGRYSNYIRYPITMDLAEESFDKKTGALLRNNDSFTRTVVNEQIPPWEKTDGDVPDKQAYEFYCAEFQDDADPLLSITVRARGAIEYDALLFIPSHAPDDLFAKDHPYGLRLYSRGVLIADDCTELLPSHLRFVRGVVDAGNLDLNVSRESVQDDARMSIIGRQIEKSVLAALRDMMKSKRERYEEMFRLYGTGLKYAICSSGGTLNELLSGLLLYPSAQHERLISLQEYLDNTNESKNIDIYYAAGNNIDRMKRSAAVQAVLSCGHDVLLCPNGAQDELCFVLMGTFKGASFHSVTSSNLDLGEQKGLDNDTCDNSARDAVLAALFKAAPLPLSRVVMSRYLNGSSDAASRVATDGALTISMAKYLAVKARQNKAPAPRYVLEVNCNHALFERATCAFERSDTETMAHCVRVLLGQALLAEDIPLQDPLAFNRSVNALLSFSDDGKRYGALTE